MMRLMVAVLAVAAMLVAVSPASAVSTKAKPAADAKAAALATQALNNLPPAHNSEFRLQPNTVKLLRLIERLFPYYANGGSIYGWREDPLPDHPSGQALDIMLKDDGRSADSVSEGGTIAAFLMANTAQLGVVYMVFRQHVWYPGQGWHLMGDRHDWTQNHMNHVHVMVNGQHVPFGPILSPTGIKLSGGQMPDAQALARAQALRIAMLRKNTAAAKKRFQTAVAKAAAVKVKWGKQGIGVTTAQRQVDQTIRRAYMLAGDEELVTRTEGLFIDPRTLGIVGLVADRQNRLRREAYEAAKKALVKARLEVAATDASVEKARAALGMAEQVLREASLGI